MVAIVRAFLSSLSQKWNISTSGLQSLINMWMRNGPPPALALAACPSALPAQQSNSSAESPLTSIFNGILLAVPKHRRSLEKRLFRKHRFTGFMEHAMPKNTIIPCLECGNFKEKGHLCGHCYDKVRKETKEMQVKMGDDLHFNIPRSEVDFVYESEKAPEGKFVVKMEKPRPGWFPKRLMNKTGS
ncbi:unnamed protein product [Candidula unifasciata]|uniref:Large ribosomal subunit protein bL32m n=1 Tax=Candidula unifasciata TaxID=100452 RepID=A0A8S3Z6R1_9EUPU|nr:unnamed protein product [Candidula unifasciata]